MPTATFLAEERESETNECNSFSTQIIEHMYNLKSNY